MAHQIKIGQTKFKTCCFGPAIFHRMMSLVKGTAQHTKMSSGPVFIRINVMILLLPVLDWPTIIIHPSGLLLVVNKCDDTAAPCVGLANDNYSSKWFVISSLPLLECPV